MRQTRRGVLGCCVAALGGFAGCGSDAGPETTATDQAATDADSASVATVAPGQVPDLEGYLDGANNHDGAVVDAREQATTTVDVGAGDIGYGFGPAAVWVDTGTTARWEWTGEGGPHNVVSEDETLDSGPAETGSDTTYEHTFEGSGVYTYYCAPHRRQGMRGVVVVGDV